MSRAVGSQTARLRKLGVQPKERINNLSRSAMVSTFAGSTSGYLDGTGTAAQFNFPVSIVIDSGNLYVSDTTNHRIRKIVIATGVVTTLAGSGTPGTLDGTGTAAEFNFPGSITLVSGSLYLADRANNRIRRIVISTGVVTTLAGSTSGYLDGTGTAAQFNNPVTITSDSENLYVGDSNNFRIRKIVISNGIVTTFAGSGVKNLKDDIGLAADFDYIYGIVSDNFGNLYVTDPTNNVIRKIVISTRVVTTIAGSTPGSADGIGAGAQFNLPFGISASSSGNLYVGETGNDKIRYIDVATLEVITLAGTGVPGNTDGLGTEARFNDPRNIAIDPLTGVFYVADGGSHRIRTITFN